MSKQSRERWLTSRPCLTLSFQSSEPPTEFCIFTANTVETTKGQFTFDAKAAKLVLAEYKRHGVDLMIDYDHASLATETSVDPALAGKAAGWFGLEMRQGALWAINVRWTPPAADALRRKEWRFMSPAFGTDDDNRITSLLNVAITNLPATRRLEPLVAAKKGTGMDHKTVTDALEAIEAGDMEAAKEILKAMIATAASGEEPGADDGAEGDSAEGVAPPKESSEIKPKVTDTSGDAADPGDPAEDPDEKDDADPAKKPERKAMRAMLRTLTGAKTFGAALTAVESFRKSHLTLETERTKLAAERAVLESAERRACVVELVTLGAEFPSTVWADDKAKTIKPRWLKMPIEELRAHTVEQRAARKGQAKPVVPGVRPPPGTVETVELSAVELQICKDMKCEPADYVRLKVQRDGGDGSYFQSIRDRDAAAQALIAKVGT